MAKTFALRVILIAIVGIAGATTPTCASDDDCQLNGACNMTTGVCTCIASWRGHRCEQLNLLPARPDAGLQQPHGSSWGGSILRDDADPGLFHLFVAVIERGCGLHAWRPNSAIAHATSRAVDGPYGDLRIIKPHFAHEPVAVRAPDGTILVYHIGAGANGTGPGSNFATNCSGGHTGADHEWQPGVTFYGPTSVLFSRTPVGPWRSLDIGNCSNVPGCPQCGDTNPAPVIEGDGTVRLMWRGSGRGIGQSVMFPAHAPCWQGPYTWNTTNLFPGEIDVHIEDAHMWQQEHRAGAARSWHAVFHSDVEGKCNSVGGGNGGGGHAWSADGVNWSFSPVNAYCNKVSLSNGSTVTLRQRERPHVLVDARGHPVALSNGAGWVGDGDRTFTFVQPVAH